MRFPSIILKVTIAYKKKKEPKSSPTVVTSGAFDFAGYEFAMVLKPYLYNYGLRLIAMKFMCSCDVNKKKIQKN